MRMLLSRDGIKLNSKSMFGLLPLIVAVENGHEAVVQLLLSQPDINQDTKDDRGRTLLRCASREGHKYAAAVRER